MRLTRFAQRFTGQTGIGELMDDLGNAMQGQTNMLMLGGGNPAHIPEVNAIWRKRTLEILAEGRELENTLANYDIPQGKISFLEALAGLLNREFGWDLDAGNIAVCNGSQTAFFLLLNIFSGLDNQGRLNRILFPLCPEYIGYADQTLERAALKTQAGIIKETRANFFKYHVDFDRLSIGEDVSAICVSRPTNPTGNVLTDAEIKQLAQMATLRNIPLIIDNAYGAPFPHILFKNVRPYWDNNIILSMSLSKLGLPSVRTGIIIASKEIIRALSASNAIVSLSNGSFGQVLTQPLIQSGDILSLSRDIICPFYRKRSESAIESLLEAFSDDVPFRIHESEGSIFLWLWLPGLPITSSELYERLKKRGVIVVSGHYFFFGLEEAWTHSDECLRLSYALDPEDFRKAVHIIADEIRRVMDESG